MTGSVDYFGFKSHVILRCKQYPYIQVPCSDFLDFVIQMLGKAIIPHPTPSTGQIVSEQKVCLEHGAIRHYEECC